MELSSIISHTVRLMSFGSTTLFSRFSDHAFVDIPRGDIRLSCGTTLMPPHEMLVKALSLLIIYKTHVSHNNLVSSLIAQTESKCFQMDHRLLMGYAWDGQKNRGPRLDH